MCIISPFVLHHLVFLTAQWVCHTYIFCAAPTPCFESCLYFIFVSLYIALFNLYSFCYVRLFFSKHPIMPDLSSWPSIKLLCYMLYTVCQGLLPWFPVCGGSSKAYLVCFVCSSIFSRCEFRFQTLHFRKQSKSSSFYLAKHPNLFMRCCSATNFPLCPRH